MITIQPVTKINDVIPLNFLLHCTDKQIINDYHKALEANSFAHSKTQLEPNARTRYPRKAHNQPITNKKPEGFMQSCCCQLSCTSRFTLKSPEIWLKTLLKETHEVFG